LRGEDGGMEKEGSRDSCEQEIQCREKRARCNVRRGLNSKHFPQKVYGSGLRRGFGMKINLDVEKQRGENGFE